MILRRERSGDARALLIAAVLGAAVAVTYLVFEWLVRHGTDFVWNDLFGSDTERWIVVPLALGLSILFSTLLRLFRQPRFTKQKIDLLAGGEQVQHTSLGAIGTIFIVGLGSLIAGASLGPEASLLAVSTGLATWAATRSPGGHPRLLSLAAVGALLVSFFGSLLPVVAPLLLVYKERGKITVRLALLVVLTGLTAYATLALIQGSVTGYGSLPIGETLHLKDYLIALALGTVGTVAAVALKSAIVALTKLSGWINRVSWWPISAAVFGLGIGLLYLLGGESIQFSGSEGVHELAAAAPEYGAWTLLGLVVLKLLVTAWSEATGYRGGLVFPSVYVGTALSLLAGTLFVGISGPGAMAGSVGGIMSAMTTPPLAAIMLLSLMPMKMAGLGLAGVAGAVLGQHVLKRFVPAVAPSDG